MDPLHAHGTARQAFVITLELTKHFIYVAHASFAFINKHTEYRHEPLIRVPPGVLEARAVIQCNSRQWKLAYDEYKLEHPNIPRKEYNVSPQSEHSNQCVVDATRTLTMEAAYYTAKYALTESLQDPPDSRPWNINPGKLLRVCKPALALLQAQHEQHIEMTRLDSGRVDFVDILLMLSRRTCKPEVRAQVQDLTTKCRGLPYQSSMIEFGADRAEFPPDFVLMYELSGH
jgi:hypothetical protein